jgi:hypothetical protein
MSRAKVTEWTSEQEDRLCELYSRYQDTKRKWDVIGKEMDMLGEKCRSHWRLHKDRMGNDNIDASSRVEYGDDSIHVVKASPRIMSQEELMEAYNIDPTKWRVEKYIIRTSEGYRKDRQVSWHVIDGRVTNGDVEDSGKMLVVPLYHMELRLIRKEAEIRARDAIEEMIQEAKKYSPKYPTIKYFTHKDKMLYEIAMPDIHFGRLTWHEESGDDFDIKIAERVVRVTLSKLLQYSKNFEIGRILLPIGNDFFNVNNKINATVRGTPQQEDTRWQKTFRAGRRLAVEMIDTCIAIAPTDVLFIPGNHDEEKIFYLGDALECWYRNNKNVNIDNNAKSRKYYDFGKILLGFTHGDAETTKKLPNLMQFEVPKLWGNSIYREWHTGDKHRKADFILEVDEQIGIVIRTLRSLVPADAWTFNHGFVGSQHASEAFLWHPENGLIAQFTAGVDYDGYREDDERQ